MNLLLCLLLSAPCFGSQNFDCCRPSELKRLKKVFIDTSGDMKNRAHTLKEVGKANPGHELLGSAAGAELILSFKRGKEKEFYGAHSSTGDYGNARSFAGYRKINVGAGTAFVVNCEKFSSAFSFGIAHTTAYPQEKDVVLFQGNPPLTQSMVNKTVDLLEWSLGISFAPEQKSKIQQILINAWQANNRAQIRSILDVVGIHNNLSQMSLAERNNFRERFKTVLLENLRKDPDDQLSQTVLSVLQPNTETTKTPDKSVKNTQPAGENELLADAAKQNQTNSLQRSDGLWTFTQGTRLSSEQAQSILRQVTPINRTVAHNKSLGFEEAIANARKFLNERASPQALAAFSVSQQAGDAKRAGVAAGGAMVANKPLAALAALLRAHELQPQNATYLANLAAVLSYMGMPQEALAILDSPLVRDGRIGSPLGMGGQASALNTRGHSLLQVGKFSEAEAALRRAVSLSPNLTEAKTHLALALWMQDDPRKKEEGGRLIAAVWRRNPRRSPNNNPGKSTPPRAPEEPGSEEIGREIFEADRTGAGNLDLSRGKRLKLPDLKIPANVEASVAMHSKYQALRDGITAILNSLSAREEQLLAGRDERFQKEVEKAANSGNPSAVMAITERQEKYEKFRELVDPENVKQHPSVSPLWEKARQARINNYQGVHFDQRLFFEVPAGVADHGSQSQQLTKKIREIDAAQKAEGLTGFSEESKKRYNRKKCAATREAHAKWRSAIHDYDSAHRNYLQAAYKHMTAVIANIADPFEHELNRIQIERYIYFVWQTEHIDYADSFFPAADRALKAYCDETSSKSGGEDLETLEAEKPDICPEVLKGANKAKVDFELVSVSFNCEAIGIEVSSPWLGLFVEAEGTFKGGWISQYGGVAIGFGVKGEVEIPGLPEGVEGKAGGYVKLDKDGNIKDAGFKTGTTITKGIIGPVAVETGTDYELTILPALGFDLPQD